jgi:hypothetical protein
MLDVEGSFCSTLTHVFLHTDSRTCVPVSAAVKPAHTILVLLLHSIFPASIKHVRTANKKIKLSYILHEKYNDFLCKFLIFFNFSEIGIGYFLLHKGCHFVKLLKDFKADGFPQNALAFTGVLVSP